MLHLWCYLFRLHIWPSAGSMMRWKGKDLFTSQLPIDILVDIFRIFHLMRYKYEILRQGLCSQWYGCHVLSFECIFFYSLELLQMVHDILNTKKWNLNLGSSFECFMAQTGFILQQFVQQPSSAAALMIQSASSSCYLLEAKTLWSPIWWKFQSVISNF